MSLMSLSLTAVPMRRVPRWNELKVVLVEWRQRARSRYERRMLADREVCDMGMTRLDAANEASKPFWQR